MFGAEFFPLSVRSASELGMKVWVLGIALLVMSAGLFAGTVGSFAGTVVQGSENSREWLYVEGRNRSVRRVNVSRAKFRYDDELPSAERSKPVPAILPAGTEVRVEAEQDESGEWRATDVEILKPVKEEKKTTSPTTSSGIETSKKVSSGAEKGKAA